VSDSGEDIGFSISWPVSSEDAFVAVNHFVVQSGLPGSGQASDGFIYLVVGHAAPPILLGSEDQQLAAARAMGGRVPVQVHGRFAMPISRAKELLAVLQAQIERTERYVSTRVEDA
jgi:hypothetical protein